MQCIQVALIVAAIATHASFVRAQETNDEAKMTSPSEQDPELFGTFQGTYLSVGGSGAIGFAPTTGIFGGELSLVRQTPEFYWFGVYADLVRDLGREQTRLSIGPEFGWSAFGLDLGYVAILSAERVASGVSVRPMLTMGFATLFARLSHDFSSRGASWIETGLLLKYPFEL